MKQMYHYSGPFYNGFGRFIGNMEFFTQAVSREQARSYILYQAKTAMGLSPSAKLRLEDDRVFWVEPRIDSNCDRSVESEDYHQMTLEEIFKEAMV